MKKGWIWVIVALVIIVIITYYFTEKQKSELKRISKSISADGQEKTLTYKLPTSLDTEVFGPHYWAALHNIVDEIPCSICRNDAIGLISGMHDVVNVKLEKPVYDEENFNKFLEHICTIKTERDKAKVVEGKSAEKNK